ncbi:hypothetical protein [Microlunatus soli]|uniref:DUF2293 domain-containing protein n=1 Tax=Microlunatus soli TaxID=630515 RepID=A0A1H1YA46_9ACTN|nr:hypothetical protein [Microlunatus soli]SDT18330.1 hypothetical protein SAMN04489812_4474 [Microlunatus soli]
MANGDDSPREPLVIISRRPSTCAGCGDDHEQGGFLTMDDVGSLCMDCADFGQLDFLPRGDTALTRRARKAGKLSVVVVEWSRTRKRYERQGVLAEPDAIDEQSRNVWPTPTEDSPYRRQGSDLLAGRLTSHTSTS